MRFSGSLAVAQGVAQHIYCGSKLALQHFIVNVGHHLIPQFFLQPSFFERIGQRINFLVDGPFLPLR